MAEGAWVPAFDSVWRHRKTTQLVRETAKIPMQRRHAVAGMFLELMAWARDTVEDGDLGRVDPGDLAAAVGLPRVRGTELLAALKAAELVSNDVRAHVVGWDDGPGKLVASRRSDRLRKEHSRAGHPRPMTGCPLCARLSGGQGDHVRRTEVSGTRPATQSDRGRGALTGHGDTTGRASAGYQSDGQRHGALPLSTGQDTDSRTNQTARPDLSDGQDPSPLYLSGVDKTRVDKTRQEPPNPPPPATDMDARVRADLVIATATEPWATVLAELRAQGANSGVIASLFARTRLEQRNGNGTWVLYVSNEFTRDWVLRKYALAIRDALQAAMVVCTTLDVQIEGGPREPDVVEPGA